MMNDENRVAAKAERRENAEHVEMLKLAQSIIERAMPLIAKDVKKKSKAVLDGVFIGDLNDFMMYAERLPK